MSDVMFNPFDEAWAGYWPCATCGVDGQEPCRTVNGVRARGFHRDRYESARLWRRYGRHNGTGATA
jgi:hypothetical protein